MKILHVNKFFDLFSGTETYLHSLMEEQRAAGHEVHAFSTQFSKNLPSDDAGSFVERLDFAKSEGAVKDAEKAVAFIWNQEARRSMRRALREIKPDVVHLHNIYHHLSTSILGPIRQSGIPCVQTLHDYKLACPNYKMFTEGSPCERCKGGRYLEAVKHHCLTSSMSGNVLAAVEMGYTKLVQAYERTVHTFLCPSQFMADKMAAWGEPPSKLRVMPNPIALPEARAMCDGEYFLVAGRLSTEKGLDTLIRAAAAIPQFEIRIAGTGPEEARLKALVATLKLSNVQFLGYLRKADLAAQRARAAALVISSIWYDNAPFAVLEAMAEGLPVIASRIGGLPELVENEVNGLTVDPGNVEAWGSALRGYLERSLESRLALGEGGIRKVEARHTWDKHLVHLFEVYHEAGAR